MLVNVMAESNVMPKIVILPDNGTSEPATYMDTVCAYSKGIRFLLCAAEPINIASDFSGLSACHAGAANFTLSHTFLKDGF